MSGLVRGGKLFEQVKRVNLLHWDLHHSERLALAIIVQHKNYYWKIAMACEKISRGRPFKGMYLNDSDESFVGLIDLRAEMKELVMICRILREVFRIPGF